MNSFNNTTMYSGVSDAPPAIRYTRLILYPVVFAIGLIGNSIVSALILKKGRNSSANGYFILNLALSDLMAILLYLPFDLAYLELKYVWPFGAFMCKFINSLNKLSVMVSGLTLSAIGVDRYKAIVHSLKERLSRRQAFVMIVVIWIFASGLQLPYVFALKLDPGGECRIDLSFWENNLQFQITYIFGVFTPEFVIPAIALGYCYIAIALHLERTHQRNSKNGLFQESTMTIRERQNRKTTQVLTGLVTIYTICVLPHQICVLMITFDKSYLKSEIMRPAYEFTRFLSITNSCLNPIMYSAISKSFRKDIRNFFRGKANEKSTSMRFLRSTHSKSPEKKHIKDPGSFHDNTMHY
ncbi:galanin receptor type 1 [Exaiptasia diaphana]|uniref:G-protein coupled receptors family 1 profile domain-containing protein n=1 Tax=Exaiptasia diaphana TaxID=2652724 RepID=A0A913YLF3_EXADI|nr:galanin receptor type 1 [Exaiptasia diaphana]XP_020901259.1 galanin receptor type 1 [Exaiptasia diaphana]XP_020901260.1 galanin receptor type 1 [Exaiptasia diaphana]XP_020901261.1 galanin receptor type 1 [Exaiptasia diaphana]XP_020901262.1 galanin receptor type 1 [Exaiptasia diaphana]XP_020901264.1 galanin receptor type 1 [Exaiptasia diaphana]XP_020901265.1 galanin receptor type 1 [Exaiptasia diaphana]XP_028515103.1 galanin receptor type 1 [Exaiptasia diaphana]XP_028515104.1 galanin rece